MALAQALPGGGAAGERRVKDTDGISTRVPLHAQRAPLVVKGRIVMSTLAAGRLATFICLAVLLAAGLAAVWPLGRDATAQTVDVPSRVDQLFASFNRTDAPGCAVGAAVGGKVVLTRAYGMADLEQDRPVTTGTLFEPGSIAKQFTAMAVLLLAKEGKLSLDDPVQKYLPEIPEYGKRMTIRHMLTHTSGLRDWGHVAAVAGWPRTTRMYRQAHALDIQSRQKSLNFDPGAEYSYTNSGFTMAAIIVSRVSDEPFTRFTRRRLLEPLGMTHTLWRDDYGRVVERRASAYMPAPGGSWQAQMPFEENYGHGGLLTTVEDLLAWNENYIHARVGGPEAIEQMTRRGRLNDGREIDYGLGLNVTKWRGVREVSHGGGTASYRASLVLFPDQKVSVAVLCNGATANAAGLAHSVAELYLGGALLPAAPAVTFATNRTALERRTGVYFNRHTNTIVRLVLDGDRLRWNVTEPSFNEVSVGPALTPVSDSAFLYGGTERRVEFSGEGDMRVVSPNGDVELYERQQAVTPSSRDLAAYEGLYRTDEAETEVVAKVENGGLVLRQRPDIVFTLQPAFADAFTSELGNIVFRRDSAGRVEGFSLGAPRIYDLRFARVQAATSAAALSR